MVKFAKELQSQLVPEWQEKYCDYAELKSDLKRIHQHRTMGATYTRSGKSLGLLQSVASTGGQPHQDSHSDSHSDHLPRNFAKVNKIRAENGDTYVTELQEPLPRSPQDRTFFARLDAQLTKVNKFYEEKEAENIARAGDLEKQMLAWINSQEAIARQDLLNCETHVDYVKKDMGAHMSADHLQNPNELSGEFPLIREGMERSKLFLMRASGSTNCDDEDETDDAIPNYIEEAQSKNLKSGYREHYHIKRESAASGSILKLRSAVKTVEAEVKVVELFLGEDDNENQKTYSQRELDRAKKMLQRAFR